MRFNRSSLLASTVLAGVVAAAASAASAQVHQPASDAQATEVGEIVVTGSRIRRSAANAPTPIIQVSQEEILSTGQTSVIDSLATLPAPQNSTVPSDTTGPSLNAGGLSLANLRSL